MKIFKIIFSLKIRVSRTIYIIAFCNNMIYKSFFLNKIIHKILNIEIILLIHFLIRFQNTLIIKIVQKIIQNKKNKIMIVKIFLHLSILQYNKLMFNINLIHQLHIIKVTIVLNLYNLMISNKKLFIVRFNKQVNHKIKQFVDEF